MDGYCSTGYGSIEMIVRPGAVGLLRRTACILIAAYAAAMLPAVPAGAANRGIGRP